MTHDNTPVWHRRPDGTQRLPNACALPALSPAARRTALDETRATLRQLRALLLRGTDAENAAVVCRLADSADALLVTLGQAAGVAGAFTGES